MSGKEKTIAATTRSILLKNSTSCIMSNNRDIKSKIKTIILIFVFDERKTSVTV
jgi:hypothetical protein